MSLGTISPRTRTGPACRCLLSAVSCTRACFVSFLVAKTMDRGPPPPDLQYQPISFTATKPLSGIEARKYLEDPSTRSVSSLPMKLYLVRVDSEEKQNDYRSCGHRLYQSKGGRPAICGNAFEHNPLAVTVFK